MNRYFLSLSPIILCWSCADVREGQSKAETKPVAELAPASGSQVEPVLESPPPKSEAKKRPKLVRAQPLPKLARFALHQQMVKHGDSMESLLWSALMLDYESIELISKDMSLGPTLSRPMPGVGDTINALLPPRYFTLQDQLAGSIGKLRDAASAKDDAAMAVEYANVAQACIQCHSLYLTFPSDEE